MVPRAHCGSLLFAAAHKKFFGCVICMAAIIHKLCSLLSKARISERAAMSEERSRQGIWRAYVADKSAELFHSEYSVLAGLADASDILTEVLNVVGRPELFCLEPLQTLFDLVISTFTG